MQNIQDYVIETEIGHGSFATVYKGYHKVSLSFIKRLGLLDAESNLKVAIKAVQKSKLNKKLAENLETEISILKGISHPNIVKLYDIQKTESKIYLVMEFCAGGDLSNLLKKKKVLDENAVRHFIKQLASALECLRTLNFVHRDLKPQNLLLSSLDENAILKIADFGFARHIDPSDMADTLCGSPLYMAPEILRYEKYDAKADLWSVGTIMYEMFYGRPPFRAQNHIHLLKKIESCAEIPFLTQIPIVRLDSAEQKHSMLTISISESCKSLIRNLLKRNPIERIGFEEFFLHPFLNLMEGKAVSFERKAMSSNSLPKYQNNAQRRPSLPMAKQAFEVSINTKKIAPSSPRTIRSKSFGQSNINISSIPKSIGSVNGSRLFEISSFGKEPTLLLSTQKSLSISYKNVHKEEIPVLQQMEQIMKFAQSLIEIMDQSCSDSTKIQLAKSIQESLLLLVKATSLYENAIRIGKAFWELQSHLISPTMIYVIQFATEEFKNAIEKADKLKSKLLLIDNQTANYSTLEDLVYSFALQLSRNAAVDELLGYFHSSEKSYLKALFLLNAISANSQALNLQALSEVDLKVIEKYISNIQTRLSSVQIKKERKSKA